MLEELKKRARHLKAETFALYLAARDPRTPWYAKLVVAGIVASIAELDSGLADEIGCGPVAR